jgi:4-carboxymuconolactone decarboxylase
MTMRAEEVDKHPRETVASLISSGGTEQLRGHLNRARQNGLTDTELKEAIVHLAFYAGWPKAMSAITVAQQVFDDRPTRRHSEGDRR